MSGIVGDNLGRSSGLTKAAGGGGAWKLLEHQTASTDSLIEFTGLFSTAYDIYKVFIANMQGSLDAQHLYSQWRQTGSYLTSGYRYSAGQMNDGTTISAVGSTSASQMRLTRDATGLSVAGERSSWEITLGDPLGTNNTKAIWWNAGNVNHDSSLRHEIGAASGAVSATGAMDGIKFYMESGNIVTGEFSLFGLVQA